MRVPEGMTAEKLRVIADWLDTYDKMARLYIRAVERGGSVDDLHVAEAMEAVRSTRVQDDLRRWATELSN